MIRNMLAEYNITRLAKINANDDPDQEIIYIEMNKATFKVTLSNGEDTGEADPTNEKEALELAATWQNWDTFEWLI